MASARRLLGGKFAILPQMVGHDAKGARVSQLSLYLDEETMRALREMADAGGVSLSKCAAELIRSSAVNEWPPGYERVLGCIDDPTFVAPVRIVSKFDAEAGRIR